MKGKKWDDSVNQILIDRYSDTENSVLVKETGYSERTIIRHAKELGLSKSKEHLREMSQRGVIEAVRTFEYYRLIGKKRKGHCKGGVFKKGRIPDPDTEKKRIASIRERSWADRVRIMHGLRPIAKWKYDLTAYDSIKSKQNK